MISSKDKTAYKTIGEIAKELDLIDKKTGSLQTHTLRYWEKQFKQIKPEIRAGNRRYYSVENFKNIKKIKYLLKIKGLTINGVKKMLDNKDLGVLDENVNLGVYSHSSKNTNALKNKVKKISQIVKDLKKI